MTIPYRTQQLIKRLSIALLVVLVVSLVVGALWFLWLQRYVLYTRDEGAVLNFEMSEYLAPGTPAVEPEANMEIEIYYNEGEDKLEFKSDFAQLKGYYVLDKTLGSDPDGVWEKIQSLAPGTAVMLDVKNIYGMFYYSTATGRPTSDEADVRGVDTLIRNLKNSGYYTIARVPAMRDRAYGLEDPNEGLPVAAGYLWMDAEGCYWLDPTRSKVQSYLTDIATELRMLGFDEVVFDEFYFPSTDSIVFHGDKKETLESVAQTLVDTCSTDDFAVSFVSDGSWQEPTGRSRVYREDISDTIKLLELNNNLEMENAQARLVLITHNMDSKFEEYGVMRPIEMAY